MSPSDGGAAVISCRNKDWSGSRFLSFPIFRGSVGRYLHFSKLIHSMLLVIFGVIHPYSDLSTNLKSFRALGDGLGWLALTSMAEEGCISRRWKPLSELRSLEILKLFEPMP